MTLPTPQWLETAAWFIATGRAPLDCACLGCRRLDVRISLGGPSGAWLCPECRADAVHHAEWCRREGIRD